MDMFTENLLKIPATLDEAIPKWTHMFIKEK